MILQSDIFFRGDIIDLSFVCSKEQIENLLLEVENYLLTHMFCKRGELSSPPQQSIINVLKYFAFIEMVRNITNDFDERFNNSYFSLMLQNDRDLAFSQAEYRIRHAQQYGFKHVTQFDLPNWEIDKKYKKIVNYL